MFSSNIHLLPSLYHYADVVKWFDETRPHKRKPWGPNERGLDGDRKWHYRIEKEGDTYKVCLYNTPIVTWHGPKRVTVDVSWASTTTKQFAHRYTPAFGSAYSVGIYTVFEVDGIKWWAKAPFTFEAYGPDERRNPRWRLTSTHEKIKRKVLDPDKAWEYRQASAPFKRWVRGVWALSGNDGSHPWEDASMTAGTSAVHLLRPGGYDIQNKDDWENIVQAGMKVAAKMFLLVYGKHDVEKVIRTIDRAYQEDMYITIDYDAPLPKRTK